MLIIGVYWLLVWAFLHKFKKLDTDSISQFLWLNQYADMSGNIFSDIKKKFFVF